MDSPNNRGIDVPSDILARGRGTARAKDLMGTLPKILDIPLPWVFPIPSAQDVNVLGSKQTIAIENGVEIPTAAFTLGAGVIGVLRSFTVYITDMTTATDVQFALFINGGPAPGFGQIKMFPRVASSVSNTFDCMLTLGPAAKIQAFYNNNDGGTYNVGVSYNGWVYSEAAGKLWMEKGPTG